MPPTIWTTKKPWGRVDDLGGYGWEGRGYARGPRSADVGRETSLRAQSLLKQHNLFNIKGPGQHILPSHHVPRPCLFKPSLFFSSLFGSCSHSWVTGCLGKRALAGLHRAHSAILWPEVVVNWPWNLNLKYWANNGSGVKLSTKHMRFLRMLTEVPKIKIKIFFPRHRQEKVRKSST